MSKASEYSRKVLELQERKDQAKVNYDAHVGSRPTFILPENHGLSPRRFTVSEKGSFVLWSPNEADFYANPSDARQLAIWILETFCE